MNEMLLLIQNNYSNNMNSIQEDDTAIILKLRCLDLETNVKKILCSF